jgi:hypothetical protein
MMDFETYQRFLAKADAEGIEIVAYDITANGLIFFVRNPAHAEGVYMIRAPKDSSRLICACEAGQHNVPCKHAAKCYEYLLARQAGKVADTELTQAMYC